jgi:NADH-quinone oxidoreductase subunit N
MISLAYYLKVVAAIWMRPATAAEVTTVDGSPRLAGADPATDRADWEVTAVAVLAGAAIVVFGVIPSPLLNLADSAGKALGLF